MTDHNFPPDPTLQRVFDNQNTFFTSNGDSNIFQLETFAYSLVNDLHDNFNLTDKSYQNICLVISKTITADDMQKIVNSLENELLAKMK